MRGYAAPAEISPGEVAKYASDKRTGIEAAARELRYRLFRHYSRKLNCSYIALGHTVDDLAETMITRFLQGCGLSGLHGIPAFRQGIIRPFLNIRKEVLVEYIRKNRLLISEDSSNSIPIFQRNRVRHNIIPLIEKEFPEYRECLAASSAFFRQEESIVEDIAAKKMKWEIHDNDACIDEALFFSTPESLRLRSLLMLANRFVPENTRIPPKISFINTTPGKGCRRICST